MKAIIFYENEEYVGRKVYASYKETKYAIDNNIDIIPTLQMSFLSTKLYDLGYRIWIKSKNRDMYEVKIGDELESGRVIREGINLFKLYECGEFD